MTIPKTHIQEQISTLFDSQNLAVLSTQHGNQPYASLVAFAANHDLKHVYFLTPDTTRKFENLMSNPKVAILVNNSQNTTEDIQNAISVTGTGTASIVEKTNHAESMTLYLKKHPHLKEFSRAPTTAFVQITMNQYFMVSNFQTVVKYKI